MSRKQWIVIAVLGLAVVVVLGCNVFPSELGGLGACQPQTETYLSEIEPVLTEWQDTVDVADSTARIALSPVVQDMQRLRRDAADVAAPSCAHDASGLLIIGMDDVVAGFVDFMGESGDVVVERQLTAGILEIATARGQLDALAMGMPAPTDPDGDSYGECARRVIDDAHPLSDEIRNTFSQAALSRDYSDFCQRVGDWVRRADRLKTAHAECPVSQTSHLQAARIWLEMGYSDCAESINSFGSWCQRGPQTLTATDCFARDGCHSALEQQNGFALSITRAEGEIDRFGATH